MIDKEYWFWLCNIPNFGVKKIKEVLACYGTPKVAFFEDCRELHHSMIITEKDIKIFERSKNIVEIHEKYNNLASKGIYFVSKDESEYPDSLKHIYDAPFGLYVKGKLPKLDKTHIAIVGSRECTDYGQAMASYFASELSKAGIGIISGMARGVDGYAHEGALSAGGYSYGILGCGVDYCYPKENFSLYMKLQEKGGIISEYAVGTSPKPGNFPMRNRLISGISNGILVIEAREKSGSLITVDFGLEHGKNIYAIPGRIHDSLSTGCNNLIKMGAKLVSNPSDILEDFFTNYVEIQYQMKKNNNMLETEEEIVYSKLDLLPKHVNDIAFETNINISDLIVILMNLQLKNIIKEVRKNYFSICP